MSRRHRLPRPKDILQYSNVHSKQPNGEELEQSQTQNIQQNESIGLEEYDSKNPSISKGSITFSR